MTIMKIHGGSFYTGSSSSFGLDGAALATKQQMIVVVVQYRLGLLGFVRNDRLGLRGNFGLKDVSGSSPHSATLGRLG